MTRLDTTTHPDLNMGAFRRRWIVILLILAVLSAIPLFNLAYGYFKNEELQRAQNRVSLYRSTLVNALERFQHLPFVLARDTHVLKAARGDDRAALSVRLSRFAAQTDLDAIYLMDRTGLTVSASNYDAPVTFLNQNYGFRPYFKAALTGSRGQFYGIGATTSLPGFFVAEPVRDEIGTPVGVIAIKLGLSNLEKSWKDGGEFVFASNADGVVVLSSDASWRYHTLTEIDTDRRAAIRANRQFGTEPLAPLDWTVKGNSTVTLDGAQYLHVTTAIPKLGWTLHFLTDEGPIWQRSMMVVIVVAIITFILLTIALFLRSERIRIALQASQADSRQLRATNAKLAREIEERRMAEQRLERARSELARASKLAALGQLSASVTHELGQPIAAMRNYLAAAEFDDDPNGRRDRLNRLNGLVTRIESIFNQLKFFAKPGFSGSTDERLDEIDLRDVWTGAQELLDVDIQNAGIELTLTQPNRPVLVRGNHLRLEQVLINLVRNAIAAMDSTNHRAIHIGIDIQEGRALLSVADSGQGLGDYSLEQLQEPFLTTRASGEGMGLGLAISTEIIKEHDGRLTAQSQPEGGALFAMDLPLAEQKEAA